ncbi:MAG: acetyl-CoA carboxylase biotin carboxyl carrier protein [Candidatus Xiphinematobacter sp.]|nr:MAG: acetyl-CoA carboxylase biotin carboxyl carrier protein [Candidatus Xiphinematobacter sp.]QQY08104.1 MAG: acetyl-CoA carboxylase biotin carboxyl carrier protein [Candidatus Xiphinematobacter sp.]QQY08851.1 MAG: acetyl-CoA carboxylase biotin carboxyl carrier protein [Candidatus Xiphinematobacter sp.]QQY09579.1 MAG: acetyl-CoA carboxylase biotin carboxyl carrier protein [Candidatus Xiphinematobacter sp.]QQY10334.1 MAG: acetyl-CoA carboxylase biotin carboxyl carrier protein [Candidatus Xiph
MKRNGVAFLKMEREGFRITLSVADVVTPNSVTVLPSSSSSPFLPCSGNTQEAASRSLPSPPSSDGNPAKTITSPMVGTFYTAPSPDGIPFVQVGTPITPDTVVCIVEAMKVMNEIKAEVSGIIVEVLAENETSVQFGQPLFRVSTGGV